MKTNFDQEQGALHVRQNTFQAKILRIWRIRWCGKKLKEEKPTKEYNYDYNTKSGTERGVKKQ